MTVENVFVTNTEEIWEDNVSINKLIEWYPFLENEIWSDIEEVTIHDDTIVLHVFDKKIDRIIWSWNGSRWADRAIILKPNA